MISKEVIEKYKQVKDLENDLKKVGIISVYSGAHMMPKDFLHHFKEFKVRAHSYTNPVKLQAEVEGITFFCLLSEAEAAKIRSKIKKMQKLEKESASEDKPND